MNIKKEDICVAAAVGCLVVGYVGYAVNVIKLKSKCKKCKENVECNN